MDVFLMCTLWKNEITYVGKTELWLEWW